MTAIPACPTDTLPTATRGHYIVAPPTEDAPAAFAAAVAREEGAKAMLTALEQAGVRIPLTAYAAAVAPLMLGYRNDCMGIIDSRPDPINEARLIAERTA